MGGRAKNAALDTTLDGHKRALLRAADERARAARTFGTDEAARAIRECGIRAGQARSIGAQKAQQYQSAERGPRIAAEAREMTGDAAAKIEAAGREVAAAVRKDGNDLAEKFLREGRESTEKFEETRRAGHKKIEDERRAAVDGISKSADDAINGLRQSAERLTTSLQRQQGEAGPALQRLGQAGASGMQRAVTFLDSPGGLVDSISQGPTGLGRPTPLRVLFGGQPNSAVTQGTIKGPVRFTSGSFDVQFGTSGPNANPSIGQFFPRSGPDVFHLTKDVLDAIAKIVG
jgi:hypothetical protein